MTERSTIARVALVAHDGKPAARELQGDLATWLEARGVEIATGEPDLVVSLGGDGTVLRAARTAHEADAPLLAVNTGTLGYLTEVEAGAAHSALERVLQGTFEVERRIMLSCHAPGAFDGEMTALNEVLVERTSRARLVRLEVAVGGETLTTFNADGVIVATPTGSTAYALSAGGPIVSPRAECLVITPVSPHMILSRPVVVAADETVTISVGGSSNGGDGASLVLDGAITFDLAPDVRVTARRHARPLELVRLGGPGFVERLRAKLDLPG